ERQYPRCRWCRTSVARLGTADRMATVLVSAGAACDRMATLPTKPPTSSRATQYLPRFTTRLLRSNPRRSLPYPIRFAAFDGPLLLMREHGICTRVRFVLVDFPSAYELAAPRLDSPTPHQSRPSTPSGADESPSSRCGAKWHDRIPATHIPRRPNRCRSASKTDPRSASK